MIAINYYYTHKFVHEIWPSGNTLWCSICKSDCFILSVNNSELWLKQMLALNVLNEPVNEELMRILSFVWIKNMIFSGKKRKQKSTMVHKVKTLPAR